MNEQIKFTIEVTMGDQWVCRFLSMLKQMERRRLVNIYSDGDNDFHIKFVPSIKFIQVPPAKNGDGDYTYDAG